MEEHIKQYLLEHCKEEGYEQDDGGIYEMLRDAKNVYKECVDTHRHWDDYRYVVNIGGKFIGYIDEYATGDMAGDLGFEFDPNTICEMKSVEKTIVVYEKVAKRSGNPSE